MPLRCNSWYYHNMIVYCLQNDIIKLEDIKFVIKSSLKKYYYNNLLIIVMVISWIIINLLLIQ